MVGLAFGFGVAKVGRGEVVPDAARGFLAAAALAARWRVGMLLARKPGKLPADSAREEFELEYGSSAIETHRGLFTRGTRGESSSLIRVMTRYNTGRLNTVFPMLTFSRRLLKEPHVPKDLGTYAILLRWNAAYAAGSILQRVRLAARSLIHKPRTDP